MIRLSRIKPFIISAGLALLGAIIWVQMTEVEGYQYQTMALALGLYACYAIYTWISVPDAEKQPLQGKLSAAADSSQGDGSTEASFVQDYQRGLSRLSAPSIVALLLGIALCSTGSLGVAFGIPLALSSLIFTPKTARGYYSGLCPHCGGEVSALMGATELACPNCGQVFWLRGNRFEATPPKDFVNAHVGDRRS